MPQTRKAGIFPPPAQRRALGLSLGVCFWTLIELGAGAALVEKAWFVFQTELSAWTGSFDTFF